MSRPTRITVFVTAMLWAAAMPGPLRAQWSCSSPPCATGNIWYSNGYVGIGTSTPEYILDVNGQIGIDSSWARLFLKTSGTNTTTSLSQDGAGNAIFDATTNSGSPTQLILSTAGSGRINILQTGNIGVGDSSPIAKFGVTTASDTTPADLGTWDTRHFLVGGAANSGGIGISYNQATDTAYITTAWPNMAWGSTVLQPSGGNVGIGTTDPCTNSQAPSNCKLSVAGAIQAYDVTVNNSWSDYVFDPSYRLAPLTEVAGYIQEHHHLPDIPSAREVQEKGVSLGDMQAKLLAKIEELTLHMIRAEEENRELRERIARLEARDNR